ncbi:MAG: lysylphosphatidylglycerol synthase transmembrane domain-containing protein [Acidimicrobiales bacterium]|jgi:uncharacterized protein (TIRG00374 family)
MKMGRATRRFVARYWRPLRAIIGLVLLGLAVWFITGKTSELSGASAFLVEVRWYWLALAGIVELASYLSMASMQRALLLAGGTAAKLRRVAPLTFAGNAVQSALPVGAAFAGLYYFRQYELLGADDVLSGWVVISSALSSFATLAGLAGVGLALAASLGTAFDLVEAILVVLVLALVAALAWNQRTSLYRFAVRLAAFAERRTHRAQGELTGPVARAIQRIRSVAPSSPGWATVLSWGTASWLFDCACLMFSFLSVGTGVPWLGLLLAYCAGQLAVNLPITPGGLGVVEGSLMVALVAFGGAKAATVAAVLLYRVISFWIPLPIGGACYLALNRLMKRQARSPLTQLATFSAHETANGEVVAGDGKLPLLASEAPDGGELQDSQADGRRPA